MMLIFELIALPLFYEVGTLTVNFLNSLFRSMTMWLHVEVHVSSDASDFPPKPSIGWTQNINSRLPLSPNLNTNYLFYRILIRLCRTEKLAVYTWNSI